MTRIVDKSKQFQNRTVSKKWDAWGIVLLLIFVSQFAVLCYFNLTQMRNHTGFDSSWDYLRAALMWKEKAFISSTWEDTTNLLLDTHLVPVSLLYGLTGDIMLSFGIGNLMMIVLLLFALWKIMDRLNIHLNARMIALNLVICPYMTTGYFVYNDLGYFSNLLSGASYFSLRALIVLLIIYEYLKILQNKKLGGCFVGSHGQPACCVVFPAGYICWL